MFTCSTAAWAGALRVPSPRPSGTFEQQEALEASPSSLGRLRDCVCVNAAVNRGEGSRSHITAEGIKFEDEESEGREGTSPLPTTQGLSGSDADLRGEGQNQCAIRHMQNVLRRLNSRREDLVAMNKWLKDRAARQVICQSEKEVVSTEPTRK